MGNYFIFADGYCNLKVRNLEHADLAETFVANDAAAFFEPLVSPCARRTRLITDPRSTELSFFIPILIPHRIRWMLITHDFFFSILLVFNTVLHRYLRKLLNQLLKQLSFESKRG